MFNKLTGLKLEISFLLGFPLSNGASIATFAFSGNTQFSKLEFMAVVSTGAKNLDAILMSLGGTLSIPTAFLLSISFRSFFTLSPVVGLKEKKILAFYLLFDMFDAVVVLVQVYNMLNFIGAIYIACGGDGFRLNATTYFNNVYIMAVK